MRSKVSVAVLFALLVVGPARLVQANGYKILCVRSVKATAMGEAFIVQADDPSALAFNPAGISQLRGTQLSLGGTLCNAYTEHESPLGETTDIEDEWQLVPAFFVTSDLGSEKMAVGFGASFPNGLSSRWGDDSFARYVDTFSDLTVADIGPSIGFKVSSKLRLGVGLDYYYSKAHLNRMIDMGLAAGMPGAMDVEGKLQGTGSAWGFNAGAIYEINARHSVAATYRHSYKIEYDGDYSLPGMEYDAEARVEFPAVVVLGYAYRPTDKWTIEFDVDWTAWDEVGDIEVDFDLPVMPDAKQEQNLHDTLAYKLGAQYAWTKTFRLRGGYIYNQNATPESTFRPSLPDTDTHFLTTGFGWDIGDVTVDGALQLVFYETRTVDNNVDGNELTSSSSVDGTYRTFAPCVSLAATYRF